MPRRRRIPIALTVAGSDSGGGAGIQADLKTFAALGVHGTSAITCVTAQNPRQVCAVEPCSVRILRSQLEALFEELPPSAVKTGMLYSASIIRAVADFLRDTPGQPLVVDPVMVSTSGARLLKPAALGALCDELLPLATLVMPNVPEAEVLTGLKLKSVDDLRVAAERLHERFGCAALVKGGHLRGVRDAVDVLFDGKRELLLRARFIDGVSTHGTGCTYSAAVTAFLAQGCALLLSVRRAKAYISRAIAESRLAGGHSVLDF